MESCKWLSVNSLTRVRGEMRKGSLTFFICVVHFDAYLLFKLYAILA
jgi:hypothetical protein